MSLTDEELKDAVMYVNNFFDMADRLKELDLKDVEPFCFDEATECPLREDRPEQFAQIPEILGNRVEDGFFKVPRIMGE